MRNKKIVAVVVAASILSLTACGSKGAASADSKSAGENIKATFVGVMQGGAA